MAKLPNAELARADEEKITAYLLSPSHEAARGKSGFFGRFGFSIEDWPVLQAALQHHAAAHEVAHEVESATGVRYLAEGPLETPDGRNPLVRTVWFLGLDANVPRFITAYPLRRRNVQGA